MEESDAGSDEEGVIKSGVEKIDEMETCSNERKNVRGMEENTNFPANQSKYPSIPSATPALNTL